MPITPPLNPVVNQVNPSGILPYVQQMNLGQMIGQVSQWNPNADFTMIQVWINNAARKLYDRRTWYGLLVRGQIVCSGTYSTGTVSVTPGSPIVQGSGTAWTASLVGQAFRCGYTNPIYNIIAVNPITQQLTLELAWGGQSFAGIGYYITQYYYSIPNIKYIYSALNLQLQYRLWTNMAQTFIDNVDPSRLRVMYPWIVATMPPDSNGNYQVELWPAALSPQAIPYKAYVQPPNMVGDDDSLPPYMRCDIVVAHAIADALRYRTKDNPYYSESVALTIAKEKLTEFESEATIMERTDENLWRQDVLTQAETFPLLDPMSGQRMGGAMTAAMSPVMAGGDD